MMERSDVVVVGGGPAGSSLATLVAMEGHRVILLEREHFPRYQIGESLLPATVHGICVKLGVAEELARADFVRKGGGTFRWGMRKDAWGFDFAHHPMLEEKGAGYAYQVQRAVFDKILLDNARRKGVDVREGCEVLDTLQADGRITGVRYRDDQGREREIEARHVAAAGGNTSALYLKAGEREYSKFFQNVAVFGYFEGSLRNPPPREGNITCESFPDGWMWHIPLSPTLTSVGAVIDKEHAGRIREGHEDALLGFIARCPMISGLLAPARRITEGMYGAIRVRKDYSYCNTRFWVPGLVLVGDAACFIDPVFSSGVHLATYSALLAARSINSALAGLLPEDECFREFERRYRREFNVFYEYLLRFYDMNVNEDSYFWSARKILNTDESSNHAFMRLVAGAGTTGEEFFSARAGWLDNEAEGAWREGRAFKALDFVKATHSEQRRLIAAMNDSPSEPDMPLAESRLQPSSQGILWVVR